MTTVVLARKYRPRRFDQMVGQEHVVRALTHALQTGRLHHAYLFTGTRGIGKTTVSRILAKSLNCVGLDGQGGVTAEPCGVCNVCREVDADRFIDYIELDAASNRSIDEVRDLIERAAYKPAVGRYKVFMIDEAHQLTKDAFNALLKTLEEPPEYLKFVLATTDPEKMLPTVLSRCLQFNLRPMAPDTVREHLARVLEAEGVAAEPGALRLLGRAARGSMRDALSLTDQAIAYGGGSLEESAVRAMLGAVDAAHASRLIEAIAQRDASAVLETVDALRTQGQSAAGTLDAMASLLQQMAIEQAVPGATGEEGEEARRLAPLLAPDDTQLIYSMCLQGRGELNLMSDEYGALTMVLLRPMAFAPEGSPRATARPATQPLRAPAPPVARASVPVPLPGAVPVSAGGRAPAPVPVAAVSPAVTPSVDRATPAPSPRGSSGSAPPVSASEPPRAAPETPPEAPRDSPLAERWHGVCRQLAQAGAVSGLLRELAWQSGLRNCEALPDGEATVWRLQVESDSLRTDALRDRLAAAMTTVLGSPQRIELLAGPAPDSPARRDAAERERLQAEAERIVRSDPAVVSLLQQFPGARIVPGSIKPLVNPEGTPT